MSDFERTKVVIHCQNPDCGRDLEVEYRQIWGGAREVLCRRCRTRMKFDSALASKARQKAMNLERARVEFSKAFEEATSEKIEVKLP